MICFIRILINKKVLLIVVNALTAGKDLGDLKQYIRLVVETRKLAVANGSQGLVGRLCGYHDNRNVRIKELEDEVIFLKQVESVIKEQASVQSRVLESKNKELLDEIEVLKNRQVKEIQDIKNYFSEDTKNTLGVDFQTKDIVKENKKIIKIG